MANCPFGRDFWSAKITTSPVVSPAAGDAFCGFRCPLWTLFQDPRRGEISELSKFSIAESEFPFFSSKNSLFCSSILRFFSSFLIFHHAAPVIIAKITTAVRIGLNAKLKRRTRRMANTAVDTPTNRKNVENMPTRQPGELLLDVSRRVVLE